MQGPFLWCFHWLKAALETVVYSIVIHKPDFYGFRGTINLWFRSYLQDRPQITVIDQLYISAQGCGSGPLTHGSSDQLMDALLAHTSM